MVGIQVYTFPRGDNRKNTSTNFQNLLLQNHRATVLSPNQHCFGQMCLLVSWVSDVAHGPLVFLMICMIIKGGKYTVIDWIQGQQQFCLIQVRLRVKINCCCSRSQYITVYTPSFFQNFLLHSFQSHIH